MQRARRAESARELTRREVLGAGAGALLGAAFAGGPLARDALAGASPSLAPPSADIWAPSLQVQGEPANARLTANGAVVRTSAQGRGFQAQVPIASGETAVIATSPGAGGRSAGETYTGRLRDRPTARVAIAVEAGLVRLDASGSTPDPYSGAPIESVAWSRRDGSALGSGMVLVLSGPWQDGEQYVVASIRDANGRVDDTTVVFVISEGRPQGVDVQTWQPQWVQSAVVYGAIPPLFGQPPLQALGSALDRLAGLGINVLWLAPVFATAPGDFGYAVVDYFSVRPDYGDLSDLQALVAAAHERGIRVILDLPLNDTSNRHPYFHQAQSLGQESHYWGFYERNAAGRATHYFDWKNLPNLDYGNEEVRRMASEAAGYWLRVADVDGFRCDAAWGVQERAPDFWGDWCAELRRIRPDVLLLAEATAREAWTSAAGFSAAYDWSAELGQWAWDHAFANPRRVTSRLLGALSQPDATRPFRFLENNDTGARFIARYGPQMTRAAAALLLSLPGIPCIYSGQEIGAEYEPYRRVAPLDWSADPHALEPYYRGLIAERLADPAPAGASVQPAEATPAERVLAYSYGDAGHPTIVAVNFSGEDVTATIDTPAAEASMLEIPAWSAVRASGG